MLNKSKRRPLQQQPVRHYDAQQQQGGSTEFQPRHKAGSLMAAPAAQMGSVVEMQDWRLQAHAGR